MSLRNFVVLAWLCLAVDHVHASDNCFNGRTYICDGSSKQKSCDCKNGDTCHFKFFLNSDQKNFSRETGSDDILTINGQFQGPTLIVKQNAIVVVDVVNNMNVETSMHWHGMHQWNVPWIDGVGNITQWSIWPGRKFSYIFQVNPTGTFWYHAHVGLQRGKGLFGALIIKEIPAPVFPNIGKFEDLPAQHTLVFLDFKRQNPDESLFPDFATISPCYPDGSVVPGDDQELFSAPVLNGKELQQNFTFPAKASIITSQSSIFDVEYGKTYRFRLVGALRARAYRFSIDDHKLFVIATDGYLVEPFETDYIIIHAGERYDFLLKATQTKSKWYPMRIETLAIDCISRERLPGSGLAFLHYINSNKTNFTLTDTNPRGCKISAPCKVMNCPFKAYGKGVPLECHNVEQLKLLHETPAVKVPDSENIDLERTRFFDFKPAKNNVDLINNKQLEIPNLALQVSDYHGKIRECGYDTNCSASPIECVHIIDIPEKNYKKSMRFVLSSLGGHKGVFTHPAHLHGHSFYVVKIGYPSYDDTGKIKKPTQDIKYSNCEWVPSWINESVPKSIKAATNKTVRKDTIMIPAGGYVVIEFLADNPGYWFMHCHIEYHLNNGMAVVIREMPKSCQNPAPESLKEDHKDFCWTVKKFKVKKNHPVRCGGSSGVTTTPKSVAKSDKLLTFQIYIYVFMYVYIHLI